MNDKLYQQGLNVQELRLSLFTSTSASRIVNCQRVFHQATVMSDIKWKINGELGRNANTGVVGNNVILRNKTFNVYT